MGISGGWLVDNFHHTASCTSQHPYQGVTAHPPPWGLGFQHPYGGARAEREAGTRTVRQDRNNTKQDFFFKERKSASLAQVSSGSKDKILTSKVLRLFCFAYAAGRIQLVAGSLQLSVRSSVATASSRQGDDRAQRMTGRAHASIPVGRETTGGPILAERAETRAQL